MLLSLSLLPAVLVVGFSTPSATPRGRGHVVAGMPVRAAGVVPCDATSRPCGVHFLQDMTNGCAQGQLSDFGGRREESDEDAFATAAREFCEETAFVFGSVRDIATSLRGESCVRILNRQGKYACFFHKVDHIPAGMLPLIDKTAEGCDARHFRWWRADGLLGKVDEARVVERISWSASARWSSARRRRRRPSAAEAEEARTCLSTFRRAVCKVMDLENAQPHAHERWHATISSTIAATEAAARAGGRRRPQV